MDGKSRAMICQTGLASICGSRSKSGINDDRLNAGNDTSRKSSLTRLPHRVVYEAAAITTVGVAAAAAALLALQLTQPLGVEALLFEVVSALGTVGLSVGATAELDSVGKLIIMACMFAGRVGPLTLFLVLATRERHPPPRPPIEAVPVG